MPMTLRTVHPSALPALALLAACCWSAPAWSQTCADTSEKEIAGLFDRWNTALQTGDPHQLVALYAPHSILLPTVSNQPRIEEAAKLAYFEHFMALGPSGHVDTQWVDIVCNSAINAGTYTFRFADGTSARARFTFTYRHVDGRWLISSHHSSRMPEPSGP